MFVLEQIKAHAKKERIALINREENLSFKELDARSEAFASYLLDWFGEDRTPVVIYGHKEMNFLPCAFGALKAGRAYVPVDLAVPPDRVAEIVADLGPKVIVDFSGELPVSGSIVLDDGAVKSILKKPPQTEIVPDTWVSGDTPAYILFTSGSTGKPKGVPITVNNLANFYEGLLPYMGKEDGGIILNQISILSMFPVAQFM